MKFKNEEFRLVAINNFDARRGYNRWSLPGLGTRTTERGALATADFWVDPEGQLVTRFKSQGYTQSFQIILMSGKNITDEMEDDVNNFVYSKLEMWIVSGVDDDLDCNDVIYRD